MSRKCKNKDSIYKKSTFQTIETIAVDRKLDAVQVLTIQRDEKIK